MTCVDRPDARALATSLPEALLASDFATDRRPRLINTGYGGSVRASFSGSSAYLAEAGIADGSLDGVFELYSNRHADRGLQAHGALWKLQRLVRRQQTGGFKFSPEFSEYLWHRHHGELAGVDVISNFQLLSDEFFAERHARGIGAYFYVDGTLHDYLHGYQAYDVADIDPATIDAAIEAERRGYAQADAVAVMSEFTASTLVTHYGLAREQVHVIAPGANLPDDMADRVIARRREPRTSAEVVVGFVGVYPERKGLPKLAAAVVALRNEGLPVRLDVVGRCPDEIAAMGGVRALGYLSKTEDSERFVDALAGMDIGCQLSTVEMFGIAMLEFLRCKIPILVTEVGGAADLLTHGGSIGLPGDADVDEVAGALRRFVQDAEFRRRLEAEAADRSLQVRWHATAQALGELVASSGRQ